MKLLFFLAVFFSVFLVFPKTASALIVNEVYPQPSSEELEWVELYNESDNAVNLSGWKLMDELSSPSVIFEFLDLSIEPLSYLVIELSQSKLNNAGDSVKLIDQNDNVVDELFYENSESEKSFSLIVNDNEETVELTESTKGEENISNNQPDKQTDDEGDEGDETDNDIPETFPELIISEVMACPNPDEPEWIKIFNPNQEAVSLYKWQALDEAENEISLPETTVVGNLDSTIITLDTKLLNNSGDTISLYDPNEKLVDMFEYTSCKTGVVLGLNDFGNNFQEGDDEEQEQKETRESDNKDQTTNMGEESVDLKPSINQLDQLRNKHLTINQLIDKSSISLGSTVSTPTSRYQKISIKHKERSIYVILSVIIGGAITSSSGLVFIKVNHEKN